VALLGAALPSTDGRPHDVSRPDPGQMPRSLRSSRWALRSSGRAQRWSTSCRRSTSCCFNRTTGKHLRRRLESRERRYGSASTVFCARYPQKDWHRRLWSDGHAHAHAIMDPTVHTTPFGSRPEGSPCSRRAARFRNRWTRWWQVAPTLGGAGPQRQCRWPPTGLMGGPQNVEYSKYA
jgi:hypothetical protein